MNTTLRIATIATTLASLLTGCAAPDDPSDESVEVPMVDVGADHEDAARERFETSLFARPRAGVVAGLDVDLPIVPTTAVDGSTAPLGADRPAWICEADHCAIPLGQLLDVRDVGEAATILIPHDFPALGHAADDGLSTIRLVRTSEHTSLEHPVMVVSPRTFDRLTRVPCDAGCPFDAELGVALVSFEDTAFASGTADLHRNRSPAPNAAPRYGFYEGAEIREKHAADAFYATLDGRGGSPSP